MTRIVASALLLWAFLSLPVTAGATAVSSTRHLLSASVGFDDNVFQTSEDRREDLFGRLYYRFRGRRRPAEAHALALDCGIGAKKYLEFTDRDAVVTSLRGEYGYRGMPSTVLGGLLVGKLRQLREGDDDYHRLLIGGNLQHRLPLGFSARAEVEAGWLDWHNDKDDDYRHQRCTLRLDRVISERFKTGARYTFQHKQFQGDALDEREVEGQLRLLDSDHRRVDDLHEIGIDMRWNRWLLARCAYALQINDSNSEGESYWGHRIFAAVSRSLGEQVGLHLLGVFLLRDFENVSEVAGVSRFEENDEDLSQFTARLTYRLGGGWVAEGTYTRLWTEASQQGSDYRKDLFMLGLSWRP